MGQVDPAKYQSAVPDLTGSFRQPFKLLFTHPLTDFSCLLSGARSQIVCPGLCVCDAEDKGRWLADLALAGDSDMRPLFCVLRSQQVFGVFLCQARLPSWRNDGAVERWGCAAMGLWSDGSAGAMGLWSDGSACSRLRRSVTAVATPEGGSPTFLSSGHAWALLLIVVQLFFLMISHVHYFHFFHVNISVTGLYIIISQHIGKVRTPSLSLSLISHLGKLKSSLGRAWLW